MRISLPISILQRVTYTLIYQFHSLLQLTSLFYIQHYIYIAGGDILQAGLDPDFLPVGKFMTIIDFTKP